MAPGRETWRESAGSTSAHEVGAMKYAIDPAKVAVVLTSCGRFDLLEATVASFLRYFDTKRIVIAEDSENVDGARAFAQEVPRSRRAREQPQARADAVDRCALCHARCALRAASRGRLGIHRRRRHRRDRLVHGAAPRHIRRLHRLSAGQALSPGTRARRRTPASTTSSGISTRIPSGSPTPSIRPSARLALWREIGPFARFGTEEGLSQFCKARGQRIAMVVPGVAEHIGDERHAHDPFQPRRAKTPLARLKRSLAKRWARLRGGA